MTWYKSWKVVAMVAVVAVLAYVFFFGKGFKLDGFQSPSEHTFTMYYADWCGHCKAAKPEFEKLMAQGPVDVGGTKCHVRMVSPEKEPEKAKGKPIRGFPTFLMESPDGQVVEYRGPREPQGYLEFINKTLGGKVGDVSGDTVAST